MLVSRAVLCIAVFSDARSKQYNSTGWEAVKAYFSRIQLHELVIIPTRDRLGLTPSAFEGFYGEKSKIKCGQLTVWPIRDIFELCKAYLSDLEHSDQGVDLQCAPSLSVLTAPVSL